jgi:membrane-bound ClpP family serine protease
MSYLVFATVVLIILGVACMMFDEKYDNFALAFTGIASLIIGFILVIIVAIAGYCWVASETKARIINNEYGTKYTKEDIFYGHDVIDTIQQIKRQRIEINGNIMRDK